MQIFTASAEQTKKIAREMAKRILAKPLGQKAVVIGLNGNLGGGKTTFVQGFASGLGVSEKVLSPTFVVMRKYPVPKSSYSFLFHFDCYRLQKPQEIIGLGFKEIVSSPRNIVIAEWAEKAKEMFPKNTLWIRFYFIDEKNRKINLREVW